ncbi:hypothetical protein HID58_048377 [Brassica napus]|uniref:Uncharacterized protein n=1 Tax=Brassica napus TaxID=3708 RepID=A0ABQ8B1X3_BRANA|nr:hypothetical protein HID58_048377 [Brassica napus]
MVDGSTFSIRHGHYRSPQTTCPRILLWYPESTRLSPSTKTNMLSVPPAKSQGDRHEDLNESPLQLLQAQKAQARLVESSMRILSFGMRIHSTTRLLLLIIP